MARVVLPAWQDYLWSIGEQLVDDTPANWCEFLGAWLEMERKTVVSS